ncbi:MAG: hypothetical protein ACJ77E_13075 [Gaiellaceae bacterium]
MKRAGAVFVLVLTLAGCGSGGPSIYTLPKTKLCLKKNHSLKLNRKLDFVASTSTGGALHIVMRKNAVTLVFGATVDDANNINDAYHRFRARNVGVEDILRQEKNAVLLFKQHPTDADLAAIENCPS